MSRSKEYQRLLNSKRWRELKVWKHRKEEGLCEMCRAEGIVRSGIDCHHILPVESATTMEEMTRLTFSPDNLQLLCVAHHQKVHKELGKNSKANRKQRREDAFNRWIEHLKNYTHE